MLAMIVLIVLMVVTVAAFELCMQCSPRNEESVEPQGEIAGD